MTLGRIHSPQSSRILWLDDQSDLSSDLTDHLQAAGIVVSLVRTEEEAIKRLETEALPDVFVQDLARPRSQAQIAGLPPRPLAESSDLAGWAFYREVLAVAFPQLPVIIVTWDAFSPGNRRRADDFNLSIITKAGRLHESLMKAIASLRLAQRGILAAAELPAVVTVDFERVSASLLRHLAKRPSDLDNIRPAKFEELIEVVLKELGYEVRRTKLTRDGGVDLWALQRSDLGSTLYAIDAKKYDRRTVIGPEPVRAIYGVTNFENASAGMIVTTASFGPEARRLANQYRYRVSLKDFDGIVGWIRTVAKNDQW